MAGKIAADAASMVGDAALNGVFQGLAQALTPIIQKKLGQLWGVDEQLKRLKRHLLGVQPLLNDAETRQFTEDCVRSWVSDLRGLTYDMEDIVDEMNCELLRLQLEDRNKSEGEQVQSLFSSLKLDKVFGAVENCSFNYQIASKINEVLEKWEEIVEYGNALNLREGVGGRTLGDIRKRRETTSVDKNPVSGRESDQEEIISFLKSDESSGRGNLSVIGIVGMGGLGKTTLAKLAYNDSTQFDLKAWVHVSHEFDRVRMTRCIIESIGSHNEEIRALDPMECRLQELVKDKKLLLVLDDAWTESPEDWETLLGPLIRSVQKGSKIIATTRSEEVCRSMGSGDCIYRLKALSDGDCWTIVKEKVFGYRGNAEGQANLEGLRVKVVEKCQGLPLVANVLGGLLGTVHIDKWERLLESKIWELSKTKDYVLPTLMLSYLCLNPHLKRCFTYAATCYKYNRFCKEEMIRLWMAEGFIEANKSDQIEDIANDYFDHLVARHFFQSLDDEYCKYVMHDLIRELAEVIMGNISFRIQGEIGTKMPTEETRHISSFILEVMDQRLLNKVAKAKSLRTFSVVYAISDEILKQIVLNFEHLRVLNLFGHLIQEIPKSIGNLKHLRYLDLRHSRIESLPDSICSLYNLQTLNLMDCMLLVQLPGRIESLINLQYLMLSGTRLQMLPDSLCKLEKLQEIDLSWCKKFVVLPTNIGNLNNLHSLNLAGTSVEKLPNSICKLYNLQSLCLFDCNKLSELPNEMSNLINLQSFEINEELTKTFLLPRIERFTKIRSLKNYSITKESGIEQLNLLINLGELGITNLENVESVEEARTTNVKNMHQLVRLVLEWSGPNSSNLRDRNVETEILEALEPHHDKLTYLSIKNYSGFKFPSWLGDPSFSKLVEIELIGCRKCKLLTSFGQLRSLKKLVIEEMHELKHIGREFFGNGEFPSLQILELKHLPNLDGRFDVKEGDFPHLIALEVRNCPKLRELPIAPFTLKTLRVYGYKKTREREKLRGQDLEVAHCNEMIMLKSIGNLTSLSSLTISGFQRVELLPNGFLQPLINMKELVIENCYELSSLPEGPSATLSQLCIINCPNLRSLGQGFQHTTGLERLSITRCSQLESILWELTVFSCLRYFKVVGCSKTSLLTVLPHLSTLEELKIEEIIGLHYLPQDLLLNLTTLKYLEIQHCNVLESLPNELPASLERFFVVNCKKIKLLPKSLCNLTRLRHLFIYDCLLVESFPDDGLPASLFYLNIFGCPTLTQRCQQQRSKEWSMIKRIRYVHLL